VSAAEVARLRARTAELLAPDVLAYLETGSGAEVTRGEAAAAWGAYRLRARVLTDVSSVDPSVELLGRRLATPFVVAPTAFHRLAHPEGEVATARGAGAAGALMTISSRCSVPIEDAAAACTGPWWFQVYATRDASMFRQLAVRARDAGASALVLTGDTPVVGRKPRLASTRVPAAQRLMAVNAPPAAQAVAGAVPDALEQSPAATTALIGELAELTGLPVLVKGVLRGDEALRCAAAGAAGIVVSTHGGRQLDRSISTAEALPEVVAAVGGLLPVLVDGGIGDGLDALVALALGAQAVLVGRPVVWALAAGGADGVRDLLTGLTDELVHAMTLAGAPTSAELTPDLVRAPAAWGRGPTSAGG
jgi:4-hydroxymandelate oxidase